MAYRHFVAIVVGKEPEQLLSHYDSNIKTEEPYTVFSFGKVGIYRKQYIASYEAALNRSDLGEDERKYIEDTIEDYKTMSDIDFFLEITEGYDLDEKTGDAISRENPNGKFNSYKIASHFAVPLITKDGKECFSAKKGDIDWGKVHLANQKPYEIAWDTVVKGKRPSNDEERTIYQNMKNMKSYLVDNYKDKKTYVQSSTAFWGYAFLSAEKGWNELEPNMPQFEWVRNFYDKFIKPLSNDEQITIYECIRP